MSQVAVLVATLAMLSPLLPVHRSVAASVQPLPPVDDADGRLGLCDVLSGPMPGSGNLTWGQAAHDAGARWNRWEFRWDRVEPVAGAWDYTSTDQVVKDSTQSGLDLLGILIGTPAWAAAQGQRPGNGLPRGVYLPYTDPRNLWAVYVRQTVSRYQGRVRYWEIWNEPDLHFFWMSTPDDYFQLLKVAYLTIHQVDPGARVLMAGLVVPDLLFLSRVLDDGNRDPRGADNPGYFDAVAWHAYGPTSSVYTNVGRIKALLSQKQYPDLPLWVTEDGFPASNPNGEARQAAYVLQTIAYALAAGANRVLVYRASDDPLPKIWGLISALGVPRMGYVAFQVAARYFAHAQAVTYLPSGDVERFVFYGPASRVTLLWTRGLADRSLTLSSVQAGATLVDWMGNASTLPVSQGEAQVQLPGASYNVGVDPKGEVVGGPPVLVVENNAPPAGIAQTSYLTSVPGKERKLVIFNPAATPAAVQIQAVAHPQARTVLQLPPDAIQTTDLDLLAGTDYDGMYAVSATESVAVAGVSDRATVRSSAPAATWFLAAPPSILSLGNPSRRIISVRLSAFGPGGAMRAQQIVQVGPAGRVEWLPPPELRGARFALALAADGPILVDAGTERLPALPQPQTTWYGLLHTERRLSIFDPDPRLPAEIDIHFIGARTVRGEQIALAPHHSYQLLTHGAKAVVVESSRAVAASYSGSAANGAELDSLPSTGTAVPVVGQSTRLAIFNPSQQPAHVTLAITSRAGVRQTRVTLQPMHIALSRVRSQSDPAAGVVMTSDVPVVAAPAP